MDVTDAGRFQLSVQRESLLDVNDLDSLADPLAAVAENAFYVEIGTAAGNWEVYLFRSSADAEVYLYVVEPGEAFDDGLSDSSIDALLTASCAAGETGDVASLDLRRGTFGSDDTACEAIQFYRESVVGDSHELAYRNARTSASGLEVLDEGDRANGTYTIDVDVRADRTPYYDVDTGAVPTARTIIYSASVHVTYRSADAEYESTTTIHWPKLTT